MSDYPCGDFPTSAVGSSVLLLGSCLVVLSANDHLKMHPNAVGDGKVGHSCGALLHALLAVGGAEYQADQTMLQPLDPVRFVLSCVVLRFYIDVFDVP